MEVHGSARIDWMYPNIYADKAPLDSITIALYHVRAADNLKIEFDSARNGYVLRMDRTIDRGEWMETLIENEEVGFVPAYNEIEVLSDTVFGQNGTSSSE